MDDAYDKHTMDKELQTKQIIKPLFFLSLIKEIKQL